jgi:hypothetical protein
MAPDPTALGSDLLLGPLAFLAFIAAALGYAAREYRKARDARVEDLLGIKERLEQERDDARTDVAERDRKLDETNEQIRALKEQNMRENNTVHARLVKAREMLVERGVAIEDLP